MRSKPPYFTPRELDGSLKTLNRCQITPPVWNELGVDVLLVVVDAIAHDLHGVVNTAYIVSAGYGLLFGVEVGLGVEVEGLLELGGGDVGGEAGGEGKFRADVLPGWGG